MAKAAGKNEAKSDGLEEEWMKVLDAYQYVGFDPKKFRQTLADSGFGKEDLITAIALYCQLGNNPSKATEKRKSELQSAKEVLRKIKGPITLARIAICYPNDVLKMRKFGVERGLIKARFAISVPVEYQDPALACLMTEMQYVEFNTAFSKAVGNGELKMQYYHLAKSTAMQSESNLL